ncbi:MAG: serine/threonine-protein phosphatase, partial [Micromonosporaceae bacterium]
MRRFRHSISPEARTGTSVALAAIAFICLIEAADGPAAHVVGFLAIAPFLAAAFAPWRLVVGVGVIATGLGALFLSLDPAGFDMTGAIRLGTMIAATAGAV